jgi:hypothetical protein
MGPCELTAAINAAACWLSNQLSEKELALLAASLTQLGDTLTTILAKRAICEKK